MATKADLRLHLLSHLTVLDEEATTVDAAQARRADLWIDGERAFLLERGLCWWDENSIPAAVTIPLVRYIASKCAKAFGRGGKGYEQDGPAALVDLKSLKGSSEQPTVSGQYF